MNKQFSFSFSLVLVRTSNFVLVLVQFKFNQQNVVLVRTNKIILVLVPNGLNPKLYTNVSETYKEKTYAEFGIVQLEPSALRQILDMFEGETAMLTIN